MSWSSRSDSATSANSSIPIMSTSIGRSPDEVLAQLSAHLRQALTELSPDTYEDALSLTPVDSPASDEPRMSFRVEGLGDVSLRLTLELTPTGEETCDVYAETKGGHSRHFSCDLPRKTDGSDTLRGVSRSLATFLLSEVEQHRTQDPSQLPASSDTPPHVPLLILDENGVIQEFTEGARRILEHSSGSAVDPNFFSHVHGQNLRRVMQDLAHMVSHRKQSAQWLLRLRTGRQRWRWCRAVAENHLDHPEGTIRVLLRPLSDR